MLKAAAVAAEFYCLITPDEVTPWTADDLAAYEASKGVYQIDGQGFASKGIRYKPSQGFAASLTQTKDGQWILAFRGTEITDTADLKADVQQALLGESLQYDQAVQLAQRVQKALGDEKVLLVGHSLGGGMAAAAAYKTGWRAITFNAAGLHPYYRQGTPGEIRAHYIVGELVTTLQTTTPLPNAVGIPIAHSASCARGPLRRHKLASFEPSKARWEAAQRSKRDALVSAPLSEPDAARSPPAEAVTTDIVSGLRAFVPPAQRAVNRPVETSLP